MHQNSQRLMNISEDMLMISKLESVHKAILKEQWFHLTSCVDDVFSRLDSIRETKQAALHMNIPQDWELYGDCLLYTSSPICLFPHKGFHLLPCHFPERSAP